MSKETTAYGKWAEGKHSIICNLPLIIFQEEGVIVYYCPALDVSGYGVSEDEARKSFEVTLDEYFKYTLNKNTLGDDLKRLGWAVKKKITNRVTPPPLSQLLETNKDFNRIFNTHDFRKTEATINLPCT